MEIKTNKELSKAVNEAIDASGYKKIWIAEQLGIRREVFARTLKKKILALTMKMKYYPC
uniref:DNA binding HTH domain-containing protein n=1 Tax=Eubacterium plexicaudatum ASF492 TaxID=1235802 RepID=N2AB00_9FIRM